MFLNNNEEIKVGEIPKYMLNTENDSVQDLTSEIEEAIKNQSSNKSNHKIKDDKVSLDEDDLKFFGKTIEKDDIDDDDKEIVEKEIKKSKKSKKVEEDKISDDIDEDEDINEEDTKINKKDDKKNNKKEEINKQNASDILDFKSIFGELKNKEILTVDIDDEFEGTDEEVLDVFQRQIVADRDDILNYYDTKYNGLINYLENGGDIKKWQKVHEEMVYDELDFDKLNDNQKEKAYIDYFSGKGMDDDEIRVNLRRAKDMEEFDSDVEKIYTKLQKMSENKKKSLKDEAVKQKQEQEKQYKDFTNNISNNIKSMNEFLPTTKLKPSDKEAIMKIATSDTLWKDMQKDPVKSTVILAALKYYKILDGDFSKIVKDLETKSIENVKRSFIKQGNNGGQSQSYNKSNSKADDTLNAFARTFGK